MTRAATKCKAGRWEPSRRGPSGKFLEASLLRNGPCALEGHNSSVPFFCLGPPHVYCRSDACPRARRLHLRRRRRAPSRRPIGAAGRASVRRQGRADRPGGRQGGRACLLRPGFRGLRGRTPLLGKNAWPEGRAIAHWRNEKILPARCRASGDRPKEGGRTP
jgi:hypothetical protein